LWEVIQFGRDVPTWFGVGGRADRFAEPIDEEMTRDLLLAFAGHTVRVLGDGANLLVADEGVDGLVMSLAKLDGVTTIEDAGAGGGADDDGVVVLRVGAGKALPKLIVECVRDGLSGIETLGGIPSSVGGAVVMNAGGAFGEIKSVVRSVRALTTTGDALEIPRDEIDFGYRQSGLEHLVVISADIELERVPGAQRDGLRRRLKDVMAYKKETQPLGDLSAGCCFKNPSPGVSAGMLIERAGCKGLRIGGAEVSHRHANFVITHPGCTASDVMQVLDEITARVRKRHGLTLEREVKVWRRDGR
jgi:UDP-N-acetylmuramate dehydrogenase